MLVTGSEDRVAVTPIIFILLCSFAQLALRSRFMLLSGSWDFTQSVERPDEPIG